MRFPWAQSFAGLECQWQLDPDPGNLSSMTLVDWQAGKSRGGVRPEGGTGILGLSCQRLAALEE